MEPAIRIVTRWVTIEMSQQGVQVLGNLLISLIVGLIFGQTITISL